MGVDDYELLQHLLHADKALQKGQYETSQEYTVRRAEAAKNELAGLDLKTAYPFASSDVRFSYDADRELAEVTVYCQFDGFSLTLPSKYRRLTLFPMVIDGDSYVGPNAFGVTSVIKRQAITEISLAVLRADPLFAQVGVTRSQYGGQKISWHVHWARAEAKAVTGEKPLGVLLLARLTSLKPGELWHSHHEPTIDEPRDYTTDDVVLYAQLAGIVIYVQQTGKVLARVSGR